MIENSQYSHGTCLSCGTTTWLLYGRCTSCNSKEIEADIPDFLKNLFK
jgi:predicted nucleic-acid-binding Zn-ribbon protein